MPRQHIGGGGPLRPHPSRPPRSNGANTSQLPELLRHRVKQVPVDWFSFGRPDYIDDTPQRKPLENSDLGDEYVARARQERAEITRQAILDGAATAFDRGGFEGTSLSDVVRHAGVTKGALYFHFPSKEALARTLMDEQFQVAAHVPTIENPGLQTVIDLTHQMAPKTLPEPQEKGKTPVGLFLLKKKKHINDTSRDSGTQTIRTRRWGGGGGR
ncbi:TetR/AcrR family transcriptional regulator, partial [Streptomyces sp. MB09-01]|uniref:TetR/AcrR family transcriptional regulator n=1 Tax=Streptomyces sp. MB09-01 TaxID=3028666 RepID=UPI0029B09BA6